MTRVVFVDASAWISFMNNKDSKHRAAVEMMSRLIDDGARLITTTWTAYEALTMIKTRAGHEAAKRLWKMLNEKSMLIRVNSKIEAAGLKLFFDYQDKTWGVTDCTSIALMRLMGYHNVFAFDEHFVEAGKQSGFEVIP